MEASCFLSSKPFNKSLDLPSSFLKPKLRLFNKRRLSSQGSSTVTCCSLSAQSRDDGTPPIIDSDWRSFRARLYFNEQALISLADLTTPGTTGQVPQPIKIGHKWAHPLYEPEKGCLLIATEKLDGVHIFERTVVLLISVGLMGPVGVILNRPSLMSIKETRSANLDIAGMFSGRPLFFGGPNEGGLFLVGPRTTDSDDAVGRAGVFEQVMKGLYYGTRESVGCAAEMVKRNVVGIRDFRFFDGYCGWERGQLRDEVRSGLWRIAACSPCVLGLASVVKGGLWEEVLGLVGEQKVW